MDGRISLASIQLFAERSIGSLRESGSPPSFERRRPHPPALPQRDAIGLRGPGLGASPRFQKRTQWRDLPSPKIPPVCPTFVPRGVLRRARPRPTIEAGAGVFCDAEACGDLNAPDPYVLRDTGWPAVDRLVRAVRSREKRRHFGRITDVDGALPPARPARLLSWRQLVRRMSSSTIPGPDLRGLRAQQRRDQRTGPMTGRRLSSASIAVRRAMSPPPPCPGAERPRIGRGSPSPGAGALARHAGLW